MPLGSAGVSNYLALTDTDPSYAGQATKFPKVNAGENALEFAGGAHLITLLEALSAQAWNQHFTNLLDPYGGMESWSKGAAVPPDGWAIAGAGIAVAREGATVKHGNYSAKVTRNGTDGQIDMAIPEVTYYQSRTVTFGCWVWASVADRGHLQLYDGVGATLSSAHSGGSSWEFITVTRTMNAAATMVRVACVIIDGDTDVYFDGAILVEGTICPAYMPAVKEIWLDAPLISTSYNGDSFSSGNTLVDTSALYGVPPAVRAVHVNLMIRDSGSAAGTPWAGGRRTTGGGSEAQNVVADSRAMPNDTWVMANSWVGCDANGDFYFNRSATGANTMDVYMLIGAYILGE